MIYEQDMIRCSTEYSYRPTLYCYAARTAQDRLEIKFIAGYFDACMRSMAGIGNSNGINED